MFDTHIRKMAGEQLATMDLLTKGFMVLQPITDIVENYDLVIETVEGMKKVQVKTGAIKNGRMLVDVRRSSRASGSRHYEEGAYDLLAIVNLENRTVAYMRKEDMVANNSVNIWVCPYEEVPTKGRTKPPIMFNDYLEVPYDKYQIR